MANYSCKNFSILVNHNDGQTDRQTDGRTATMTTTRPLAY